MNENLINLERMLQFHDWYYEFSDDHSAWKKGVAQRDAINQEQKRLLSEGLADPTEIVALADKYRPKNI